MKYEPKAIEFETLPDSDFLISMAVSGCDPQGTRTVSVKTSELQGLDFMQIVEMFQTRINTAFGVTQ